MTFTKDTDQPITIFIASWGRPIYLWMCLDALWRLTKMPSRIILLDNAHPDPLISEVISGFQRRGIFEEVVRFPTNSFDNITSAYQERLSDTGKWHVYMESDVVISTRYNCWLAEMHQIAESDSTIGMLGSLIETNDFIDRETAIKLSNGNSQSAEFLAKISCAERSFAESSKWTNESTPFFFTEPPCPIGNPPGRVVMLRTDVIRETGFLLDSELAESFRQKGFRPAVTARVRHRHLSLLNIFDHTAYSETDRNKFFDI